MKYTELRKSFFTALLSPRSVDANERRHEYILNVLLVTLIICMFAINSVILVNYLQGMLTKDNPLATTFVFSVIIFALFLASRRGFHKVVTYAFLAIILATGLQLLFTFGFMLPAVLLVFALVIVMAGVLIGARASLISGVVLSVLLVVVANAQLNDRLSPNTSWLALPFSTGDAFGYVVVFLIMGTVSWLSNREIDHSLQRAYTSEAALALERDNLEIKVKERTAELEQSQLIRVMELQRFAEIGRISTHLIHEVANPLTAASLHLEQMANTSQPQLLRQARTSLKQLERYVQTARNQIRHEGQNGTFTVARELKLLNQLLIDRALTMGIRIEYQVPRSLKLYGNSVKFSQVISNLVTNALDAYSVMPEKQDRLITVSCSRENEYIVCTVSDQAGGISKTDLPRIFDPLFTTKTTGGSSMGIGLSLVKEYVEKDFRGKVEVTSTKPSGTAFTVWLTAETSR